MAKRTYSKEDAVKAWSRKSGRENQYDVNEFTDENGTKVTQLIDKDTGSVTVQVDAQGADAFRTLVERAGDQMIDTGTAPEEPKAETTSEGVPQTPTQPQALEVTQGQGDIEGEGEK